MLTHVLVWLLAGIGALITAVTVLPFLHSQQAWIRWWDFPRTQLLVIATPVLVFLPALAWDVPWVPWVWSCVMLAAILQLVQILPYTVLWRHQTPTVQTAAPQTGIRILVANVYMDNRDYNGLLNLVRQHQPDLLLAVETDAGWAKAIRLLNSEYPHHLDCPLPNTYGLMFRSRLPLRNARIVYRVQDDIPGVECQVQLPSGDWVDFHGLHPRPPAPGEADTSKPRDAEVVIVAKTVAERQRPAIIAGDLNDVAWSHTTRLFLRIGQLLDPRIGRGIFPTFHAKHWFARWPLDHVFHSRHFAYVGMQRLDSFGSDHFPILAELQFDPSAVDPEDVPQAEGDDHQDAAERVAEGRKTAVREQQ